MTTFEQWRAPSSRLPIVSPERPLKKYDIRVVDQFYAQCQAIARTEEHREEACNRARLLTRRRISTALICGSLLFYHLIERVAQAMSVF
jgi:hypothetical protein